MIGIFLLVLILLVLGDNYPKIALAIAGIILLGAILFNVPIFQSILNLKTSPSAEIGGGGRK